MKTLDQFITELEAIRAKHGGAMPVIMGVNGYDQDDGCDAIRADYEPASIETVRGYWTEPYYPGKAAEVKKYRRPAYVEIVPDSSDRRSEWNYLHRMWTEVTTEPPPAEPPAS